MEPVYADVELINGDDLTLAGKFIITEEEVKRMHVKMLVDAGFIMLAINEKIQEQLKLPVVEKRKVQFANSHIIECDVVAPVELRYKKVRNWSSAIVLPGNSQPLIRSILIDDAPVRLPSFR